MTTYRSNKEAVCVNNWSVDKFISVGLIVILLISVVGGFWVGADEAWTLGRDIVIGLLSYMKGVEHKEEQKNG